MAVAVVVVVVLVMAMLVLVVFIEMVWCYRCRRTRWCAVDKPIRCDRPSEYLSSNFVSAR